MLKTITKGELDLLDRTLTGVVDLVFEVEEDMLVDPQLREDLGDAVHIVESIKTREDEELPETHYDEDSEIIGC